MFIKDEYGGAQILFVCCTFMKGNKPFPLETNCMYSFLNSAKWSFDTRWKTIFARDDRGLGAGMEHATVPPITRESNLSLASHHSMHTWSFLLLQKWFCSEEKCIQCHKYIRYPHTTNAISCLSSSPPSRKPYSMFISPVLSRLAY